MRTTFGIVGAFLLALANGGWLFVGATPLRAANDENVAKVCMIIEVLSSYDESVTNRLIRQVYPDMLTALPLPWPLLPHEILGLDIAAPPFSLQPINNNMDAWELSLQQATAPAMGRWSPHVLRDHKDVRQGLGFAARCLTDAELFFVYRQVVDRLTEGWRGQITRNSGKRLSILDEICGWSEEDRVNRSEL
jgi:hypothetical protein